jgi:hypothetical protein
VRHRVDAEVAAYRALQEIDFGAATVGCQESLDGATEVADSWEDRLSTVEAEVAAFQELQEEFDGISATLVLQLKDEAVVLVSRHRNGTPDQLGIRDLAHFC